MPELKKPKSSEMCPVGYHIVRGHERICHSGTRTWVDSHLRKNRGKLVMFRKENVLHIYWSSKNNYPKLKLIKGFKQDDGSLDNAIQFWLDYWKQQGLAFPKVDPLLIKSLIAIESTFNLKADPNDKDKIPKKAEKNIFNTIKNYHSWDKDGENYAKSVQELYEKSK